MKRAAHEPVGRGKSCSRSADPGEAIGALIERRPHIARKSGLAARPSEVACDRSSLAGSVSQRACVYSGARVVLNPIADAAHIVHGPIGCAAYTWDIRGSLSSGPQLYRTSFSTDVRTRDVIFGGEGKLAAAIRGVVADHRPEAVFVYSTCTVGIIGDDIGAVCRQAERDTGCKVIPVQSEGFRGNKSDGYKAACEALFHRLIGRADAPRPDRPAVNILGEFNVAGDLWEVRRLFEKLGVEVVASITGDGRVADISRAHTASLNLVQCSGSLTYLARLMEERYHIPFRRVSFFGLPDMAAALTEVAEFFGDEGMARRARRIIAGERRKVLPALREYRTRLQGKKAAVYVGGPAKALSLIQAFRDLGMEVAVIGTQSGKRDDYQSIAASVAENCVIVDDANPLELKELLVRQGVDIFVAGVKERYLSYKLGIPFSDFNHDRTILFAGFKGLVNFAQEVDETIHSPVWRLARAEWGRGLR